jgi:hypothetical protein
MESSTKDQSQTPNNPPKVKSRFDKTNEMGMLTIMENRKVVMKIIVGRNGHNVGILADYLISKFKQGESVNAPTIIRDALSNSFGSEDSIIVLYQLRLTETVVDGRMKTGVMTFGGEENHGHKQWEHACKTFDNPKYNPMWSAPNPPHSRLIRINTLRADENVIHVKCAKCGNITKVDNNNLEAFKYDVVDGLTYDCKHCLNEYLIPAKEI